MSLKTNQPRHLSVFALLRWTQRHPKFMRFMDLFMGVLSLASGIWQGSTFWIIVGAIFLLAAIFRWGERMNLVLPKLKLPEKNRDA